MSTTEFQPITKGDRFVAYQGNYGAVHLTVQRVAKTGAWADIACYQPSTQARWTKRQPLVNGAFVGDVERVRD